ncbi:MAG: helix-turn-helix domain-containing protein [Caulobacteraceae bacterium]|nr:helix-turn-helix domain-containing protein [Caulobacteraceae bacterium]
MPRRRPTSAQCPMDTILRRLMGPWTTYILWLLYSEGPLRFGAIKAKMPDISSKVLTDRLRDLESYGLINRDYRPSIPPSVTYSMTARANELHEVLEGLNMIALKWANEDAINQDQEHPMMEIMAETQN